MDGFRFPNDLLRFEKRILKTDSCWIWLGELLWKDKGRSAYGKFRFGKFRSDGLPGNKSPYSAKAHRVAWFLAHGSLPQALVLHHCDNPICVNPEHLYLGSNTDNDRDKMLRGRATGAKPLTEKQRQLFVDSCALRQSFKKT